MPFKVLSIAHSPDADPKKHRNLIDTGMYKLFTVVVKSQDEAINVTKEYLEKESIEAILLCPGFKHAEVAEIFEAGEGKVSVNVARGDGPSSKIAMDAMKKAGYFRS
ncbi:MAG: DUF6506 family protein [Promethearchaeota archaeon]